MPPEDIDDLFRDRLDGHATPPGDALWARLQAGSAPQPDAANSAAEPERLDHLFQAGLNAHATPPRRELWERLEDEHLRPRQQRAAAWWPMALAAALALLLVAGGAGLWLGFPFGNSTSSTLATQQPARNPAAADSGLPPTKAAQSNSPKAAATDQTELAAANSHQPTKKAISPASENNLISEATRSQALASTAPKARMSVPEQSPRYLKGTNRQPDAAAAPLPLVARTTAPTTARPRLPRPAAADEQWPATQPEPVVAVAPKPAPATEIVPAGAGPAPALASTSGLITVDVRNGDAPGTARPSKAIGLATAEAPPERQRLGGRLLQQAGHLVRGERVSLAEVTGLPDNVTVRATVAGRSLTKSIQL